MKVPLLTVTIDHERDVVLARQRSRQLAGLLGFERQDQTRIATAVSEIARNAYRYARKGRVEFSVEGRTAPQILLITVQDAGPGIAVLDQVYAGEYVSQTGMGKGIIGARRLMDSFDIRTSPAGATVAMRKILPRNAPLITSAEVRRIVDQLSRISPDDAFGEIQRQNQELLLALEELRRRQEELIRLNRELEDTNRGVLALYAELDEKADHLRRADELKSRFLSNMSHEFRTPLNSIIALSGLLLDGIDGNLNEEQRKQVGYIRRSAEDLTELVNDLLDLAKVEAGKVVVHPSRFDAADLFAALRGMLRPLLNENSVDLTFVEPAGLPVLNTDENKVSQILRNFISNALKFTERGEIRVWAEPGPDGESVRFHVSDTGIGIPPEHHERIFQDFVQLESPLQGRVRGTGLGLPLTRKLAALLGGTVSLTSEPGRGSIFSATIPVQYHEWEETSAKPLARPDPEGIPVLLVEDSPEDALVTEKFLRDTPYRLIQVTTLLHAREALDHIRPRAILLDILLRGMDAWSFLAEVKADDRTCRIPLIVVTTIDDERKALALGADAFLLKPVTRSVLLEYLAAVAPPDSTRAVTALAPAAPPAERARSRSILVVDDDETSRYILKSHLAHTPYRVIEATDGQEGLSLAARNRPDAVILDLIMPGMNGFEVLDRLRSDPATRQIPVIVHSSRTLNSAEREALQARTQAILSKADTLDGLVLEELLNTLVQP